MSTTAELEHRAENENMPPTSKKEQVAVDENMPFKSKEEQVAKNKKSLPASKEDREKIIKQRQTARVERLLHRCIPEFRTAVEQYLQGCQSRRDEMVPPTDLLFPTKKAEEDHTTRWETIQRLCEKNSAVLLFIDQFESEVREEWKGKKKGSVEKRYLYLKPKRKEFRKMRNDHEDAVRELFGKLHLELPQVEDRDKDTTDEEADMNDLKGGLRVN
jgi:hypothetical protein